MGAKEVRSSRITAVGREGPQDVLSARRESLVDLPFRRFRVRRGLEHMEGNCESVRIRCLCDGGSGVQGQMERCNVGGHLEHLQLARQQFLDSKLDSIRLGMQLGGEQMLMFSSCMNIIPIRISPNTTFSRFYP